MHNKLFRDEDVIMCSGLIVGPPDGEGDDQDAPGELVELLFNTVEFRVQARKADARPELAHHPRHRRRVDRRVPAGTEDRAGVAQRDR